MFEVYRKEVTWGGKLLTFETGKIARQADGAVMVTYGGTTVLCTAVGASTAKPGIDFFPLTVNYQEKTFAAGRIPGGFFKREGRPSEKETLVSRLIDRPIRPLFHKNYKNETQVIATVLAHDMENDPDIVANNYVSEVYYPEIDKTLKVHGTPWKFSKTPSQIGKAPKLGANNHEILKDIGYSDDRIKELMSKDII